jgi:voltage-gated potassium channel
MNTRYRKWQASLHEVIFESNTAKGKAFDIALLVFILLSILVVVLDSVEDLNNKYGRIFFIIEWGLTILFTIEYILRVLCVRHPLKYATGFLGIIDLLAILPMYLSVIMVGAQSLLVLRVLRLLRVFRIFKLTHFISEMSFLGEALRSSAKKISIFMLVVLAMVVILGSVMYLAEGKASGFGSIPDSIYWAIVTITTVGYGDITPVTSVGKFIASFIMLLGYGIIAVPTGIVTTEMALMMRSRKDSHQTCPGCGKEGHDDNASYCKYCGEKL